MARGSYEGLQKEVQPQEVRVTFSKVSDTFGNGSGPSQKMPPVMPLTRCALAVFLVCAFGLAVRPSPVWAQSESDGGSVSVGEDGFRLVSADEAFELRLRADLFADARFFADENTPSGAERIFIRRARFRVQGRVFERFAFNVRPDFGIGGPEIDDAYLEARFAPEARLRMGRFKVPIGLENLQSTPGLMHVERGFPTDLVPGRDVGVMVSGEVVENTLHYAVGLFNGAPGSTEPGEDVDDGKEGAGRVFVTPFGNTDGPLSGLGIGVGGSIGSVTGTSSTPALTRPQTTGRQTFFRFAPGTHADGQRWRVAPQARLFHGPLELLGEFTVTSEEVRRGPLEGTLTHHAWQVSGSVVVTGEDARDGSVVPDDPFGRTRGRGAVEVGARVHGVSLDDDAFPTFAPAGGSASDAVAWGLTVSWYPNSIVRMMLGFERTTFDGANGTPDPGAENMILARMQFAF